MLQNAKISAVRRSLWNRIRLQLGAGLLLSVFLPFAVRSVIDIGHGELAGLSNSLFGTLIAVIGGYYAFRRVSNYPGVRAAYQIIPSFAAAYGLVLAAFFFLRIDYSRAQFLSSFIICLIWYYAVYFKLRQQHRIRFGVVPFGDVDRLLRIGGVDWISLHDDGVTPEFLDGIVADLHADIPPAWERFISDCALQGMLVMHVKQMEESLTGRVQLEHLSENNFGSLIPGVIYAKVKRVADLIVAAVAVPLLLPLLVIVGALIKLETPGPVFFTQQRMGFRGHPFTMIKLRTMRIDASLADEREAAITQDNDDRVTKIGRVLRRYRIDELPQAINIIRGEMSWIGPRPEAVALSAWYEAELPFYRYRHIVRPGLTGWAQVKLGHVASVDEVMEKLAYDFFYVRNFSFWLDLLIVASTVRIVFGGFGAR
jgi:lipopolysaccharide/colanic/teichoic acid biosynthesis glycosyltransferase